MCTLSFIATPNKGFILTSNRDESTLRKPALHPLTYSHNHTNVTYPKDTEAGGTWLAAADNGFVLCLLNGAFTKHVRKLPYLQSRGLVIPQFFEWNSVADFFSNYRFKGIEPFTLIVLDTNLLEISEIRWNGSDKSIAQKDWGTPHIWSSATLYEPAVILAREKWFQEYVTQRPNPTLDQMLYFHHFGGNNDSQNRILMNRNNVLRTISIAGIEYSSSTKTMIYEDLLTQTKTMIEVY